MCLSLIISLFIFIYNLSTVLQNDTSLENILKEIRSRVSFEVVENMEEM